jgi:hypothetical protein
MISKKQTIKFIGSAISTLLFCGCGLIQTVQQNVQFPRAKKTVENLKVNDSEENVLSQFTQSDLNEPEKIIRAGGKIYKAVLIATDVDNTDRFNQKITYTPLVFHDGKLISKTRGPYDLLREIARFDDLSTRFSTSEVALIMEKTIRVGMSEKCLPELFDFHLSVISERYSEGGVSKIYEGYTESSYKRYTIFVSNGKVTAFSS